MTVQQATSAGELSSLGKGLEITDEVRKAGRLRAADVAGRLSMPPSTVYRYLRTLREAGYLIEVDGYFIPGAPFAEPEVESAHLVSYAAPVLARMRDATTMTALLTVRIHTAAVCLEAAFAHPKHRISFQRGHIRALYAGASALPLLAFAPAPTSTEVLEGEFRRLTSATPQRRGIEAEIERIRRAGYSVTRGQVTPGMVAVGVPVMVDGRCLCALSLVSEPVATLSVDHCVEVLRAGAGELVGRMPKNAAEEAWVVHDE